MLYQYLKILLHEILYEEDEKTNYRLGESVSTYLTKGRIYKHCSKFNS